MKAIAYYRVSTAKQGEQGLGMKAQQASVEAFASSKGYTLIEPPYVEVETGTNKKKRPELAKALKACRDMDATLLIAKLDRLARNVHFISGMMESGVKFVAVDMPEVDNLTLHILAAVAEKEAEMISTRTKAGIHQSPIYKSGNWGNPQSMTYDAQLKGAEASRQRAYEFYRPLTGYMQLMRKSGYSLRKIADTLTTDGNRTLHGKSFTPMLVKRILDRAEEMEPA